jgi:hypothetical protein
MRLKIQGSPREKLLFELIGVQAWDGSGNCGLFVGVNEPLSRAMQQEMYLVLPDPEHPLEQTEELAELLARAVGQGNIHI